VVPTGAVPRHASFEKWPLREPLSRRVPEGAKPDRGKSVPHLGTLAEEEAVVAGEDFGRLFVFLTDNGRPRLAGTAGTAGARRGLEILPGATWSTIRPWAAPP
jgi:hypothetical protein